ncbi:MAG: lamin tail domain-containing protein [Ignavibacteriales bacterium]|nr:MAG: lamin tail domain-containing protein [Ignavibacteriales bacterium]
MRKSYFFLWVFLLFYGISGVGYGQVSITQFDVASTQNFSGLGSSGTATLPSGFKIGTDWSSGSTATTLAYGTSGTGIVTGTSGGGAINWANGVTASSTDRALGFLATGSYTSPRSIIFAFTNNTGNTIGSLDVSWNYEKFRSGTRAFDWTFFHGSTSTAGTANTNGNQSYAADANNTTIPNPPSSISKSFTISNLSIADGSTYYLRWTYTGSGGSTNAQGLGIDDFSVTAKIIEPTTQSSGIGFSSIGDNSFTISWTSGNGANRVVLLRESSAVTFVPSDGTAPPAFVSGDILETSDDGNGNYFIYNGSGNSVDVTNLNSGTTYHVAIYEYNGSGTGVNYLSVNPATGNQATTGGGSPLIQITPSTLTGFNYIEGSGPSSSQTYSLSGTNLTPDSDDLTVTGSANYEVSTDNSSFGSSRTVSYSGGTLTSTTIYVRLKSALPAGEYNSEIIANSGGGATTINLTASGSVSYAEPSAQASNVTFSTISATGFTINWTSGNGTKRLVVVKSGSAVDTDPTDGVTYTANPAFGSGTQIGTGNYVVYNDNGSSVAVTGLTSGITYHVAVYEYNGGSGSENYRTSDEATGSQMTTLNAVYFDGSATYTQNFNTLASSGTSSTLPTGWYLSESGSSANTTYTAGTGTGTGGDTYSFGAADNSDRAFGGLLSSSVIPTVGLAYVNNTGGTITNLPISYIGEQWRLGATSRVDQLDFAYSTNATSLTTGTWTEFNALDFVAPVTSGALGALDGNITANRVAIGAEITGLNLANGSVLWIRWTDFNASGSDDGLAVDDFQIVVQPATQATSVNFTGVTTTGFTINWTNGSGSNRVVILKSGSAVDSDPIDGTTYSANAAFGSGTQIGTGNYVVYNGSGTSVAVTGLTSGVTYYAAVYEYDGLSAVTNYLTTSPATGNQTTLAPAIALSSPSQVVTGNIFKGSDDNVISKFQLAVTTAQATVTLISVPLAGTYLAVDIKASGLKLWYNSTNSFSGATQLGTSQSSVSEGTGETVSFSSLSQNISADATGYFFVTASIANEAGDDKTIYAGAMSAGNFTVSSGNKSGTTTQGGTQTIIANPEPVITITADPALTEENLNGAVVTITLTNVEFTDDQFDAENFTLNNVPESITIGSLEYVSTSSARCTLSYDGTDFDANITTFSITILDGEFSGSPGDLTSDNLTITATVEVVPTVTTNEAITSKTSTTAVWGGEATATGGESVTVKGIVWSTSASPTVALETKTTEGAGLGAITGNMTGLSPNTTYYVRAYATNNVGTAYGTERSFTTDGLGTPPTANAASNITSTGFTANWGSVLGASSYRLDVATDENFTGVINATDLLISEYVEGSSNNKYIEIFNGTGASVNLANYELRSFANGSTSPASEALTGTLESGAVIVLKNSLAALTLPSGVSATNNSAVNFNGDDAVAIYKISTSSYVDIFGRIGNDPGTAWSSGSHSTLDKTLRRKSTVTAGITTSPTGTGSGAFTTLETEWEVYNIDVVSGLGNHSYGTEFYVTGYKNLTVAGTSQSVTGLNPGTTYYYRVRGFSANSTSGNSGVITVRTADNSQSASVTTGNNVSAPVTGATGVEEVLFTSVATGGNINVARFNEPPTGGTSGITGNISQYRLIIEPDNVLVFDEQAGYKLRFKASDLPGITTRPENLNTTSVRLHKRSTPGSGDFSAAITMTYYRNEDPALDYLESDLITNGFSEFIFSSPDQPLPVELVSFTAKVKSSEVHLQWETATEVNNYGFEVERSNAVETIHASSTQGRTWQKIGFVEGNGNSNSPKSYSFTDRNASAGKYIYRLKQVDTDGAFDYSDEVAVDLGTPAQFSLSQNYPNPFNPSTLVQYAVPVQSVVVLEIYDITGTRVAQPVNALHEPGSYSALFNLTDLNLASGTYILRLKASDMTGNMLYSASNKMLLLK